MEEHVLCFNNFKNYDQHELFDKEVQVALYIFRYIDVACTSPSKQSTSSDWKHTKADFDKARVGLWIELE